MESHQGGTRETHKEAGPGLTVVASDLHPPSKAPAQHLKNPGDLLL